MPFDLNRFAQDNSIDTHTEGYKQCAKGWVQIECPFCGGFPHMGWNEEKDYFNCYECGWHSHITVIEAILRVDSREARQIRSRYTTATYTPTEHVSPPPKQTSLVLPKGTGPMSKRHKDYLRSRNFDPDKLEEEWDLKGTGKLGDYKFRIIAPIYHNGKLVNFQGRDITDQAVAKYKACSHHDEVMNVKECLYGLDKVEGDSIVVCEGITDVWRLGPGSVDTFGIQVKHAQVELMKRFENIFICFDTETEAQKQARKLADQLQCFGRHIELLSLDCNDPAKMNQADADELMKQLGF